MSFILTEKFEGVVLITLNRPEKFNSFNREMALQLQAELQKCKLDESVRAIVITGNGKAFCAGQDLAEAIDPKGPGLEKIVSEHYNPIILAIRNLEKPVIAAVNGVAAGAGANLALACDIVYVSSSASFIQAFSKIGLVPDSGGTYTLPRIVGLNLASALMITGDKLNSDDAIKFGLAYKQFSDETFLENVKTQAQNIASMPTKAIALTKRLLNSTFTNNLEEQLNFEKDLQVEASNTNDYKEGVNSFLEKRKPNFKGN